MFAAIRQTPVNSQVDEQFAIFRKQLNNEHCDTKFREIVGDTDFSDIHNAISVDDMYNSFNEKINSAYEEAYPYIEVRRKKN